MSDSFVLDQRARKSATLDFLEGGGEMGALMRAHDWSRTPLGPPGIWPQSLLTTVSLMLNSRHPMFIAWGPELAFLYNDGYRPIFGAKHPAVLGQPFAHVWAEIWQDIRPLVERALSGEATWSEDLQLFMERRGYPEEVYFTFSYSPVRDESGGIGGMFCACTETTERVLGERRLRVLRDLAARADPTATIEEVWRRGAEVLGTAGPDIPFALLYTEAEDGRLRLAFATGELPPVAAPPVLEPATTDAPWPVRDVLRSGVAQLVEDVQDRVGAVPSRPWPEPVRRAWVLPVKASVSGEASGCLIAGLSTRREPDGDYRAFLDLVAGQLAAAMNEARAFAAEHRRAEALAEIDRAKTAFFSNVSHEFRTPLTLMLGPTEAALASPGQALQGEELALVHRNELRLLKLVNSLLDFVRIEAGRVEAAFEPVDLAALTRDLASNFRSAIERAGLELDVDCTELPEHVHVDRRMWEKIVLNLLSNAFKFTLEGRISVRLRASGAQALLEVSDTGVGIPTAEMPRLFERFHRIEGTHGRTYEGSGIGLALVQELVKLHGGSIGAASEPGAGTTFVVRLPIGTAHLPPENIRAPSSLASTVMGAHEFVLEALRWLPEAEAQADSPATREFAPADEERRFAATRCARIVVADDNADMRAYLRELLAPHFAVELAPDGQAALEAARRRPPDLIVSDVMMPRLDGFALLRAVRADEAIRDVPLILLSARAGEESRIAGLEAGADDYLVKPFSASELLARVDANLRLAKLRREAAAESEARLAADLEDSRHLQDLSRALIEEEDPTSLYSMITEAARRLLHSDCSSQQALDAQSGRLQLMSSRGFHPKAEAFWQWVPADAGSTCGKALERAQRVVVEDVEASEFMAGTEDLDCYRLCGIRAVQSTPLVSRDGRTVGMISTHWRKTYRPSERDFHLVDVLARQAADALERRRLESERKQAEADLRSSEQRFRELADAMPQLVWTANADGTVDYYNVRRKEFDGFGQDADGNWAWDPVLHPDDVVATVSAWQRSVATGAVYQIEHRVRQCDGSFRWHLSRGVPVRNAEGQIVKWYGTATDIDDFKRAEIRIVENEERLRTSDRQLRALLDERERQSEFLERLIECTPIAIAVVEGEALRFTMVNHAYQAVVGPLATVLGSTYPEIFPEAADRGGAAGLRRVIASGEPWKVRDFVTPIGDRAETWWEGEVLPIRGRSGAIDSALILTWEVTARKLAEKRLRAALEVEQRTSAELEAIYRQSPVGMSHVDRDLRYVRINEALAAMNGAPASAHIGRTVREMVPDLAPKVEAQFRQIMSSGEPLLDFELTGTTAADPGVEHTWLESWYPLRGANGEVIGLNTIALDISARKTAEAKLASLAREREALLEAERAARGQVESANRLKDEFLATLSHELRTPLANIVSWSRVLLRTEAKENEKLKHGLDIINANAMAQARMIGDLLEMSRIAAGKVSLEVTALDLSEVVAQCVASHRAVAQERGIDLVLEQLGRPKIVLVDAARLQQVLGNLLSNAIKFTPRGGHIAVRSRMAEGGFEVVVEDSGEGIAPDALPYVFERFRQADSSTSRRHGGLGLGLALVKQIVEMHGGRVCVESEGVGCGARFTVFLPAAPDSGPGALDDSGRFRHVREPIEHGSLRGLGVLAVDDDPAALELLVRVLGEHGARVECCATAAQALARLRRGNAATDVLVSDLGMPEMDGFQLVRAVRTELGLAAERLPALAISAYTRPDDRRRALEAGFQRYLTKPWETTQLVNAVRKLGRAANSLS